MPSIINSSTSSGLITTGSTDGSLALQTGGTTALTISSGQVITASGSIGIGGTTPSGGGTGIAFPATQSASSDANTLDDYEEGTWTFGISFGGGTTGITYSAQAGSYTKIGNMVTVRGYMELSNKGSSSGSATITGLPFQVSSATSGHTACALTLNSVSFSVWPMANAQPATTTIILAQSSVLGARSALTNTDFSNSSWIMIGCSYAV